MTEHAAGHLEPDATTRLLMLVRALATELHPRLVPATVTLDSVLDRDLGIDSLSRVELVIRIEREFGVSLHEDAFGAAETVADLLRAVQTAGGGGISATRVRAAATSEGAVATPATADTLLDVLDWHVGHHPERPHIHLYSDRDDGELMTYLDLRRDAERVAAGLQALDIGPGDRIVIMLATGRDYFLSFFGILLAGAVPVPIYPPARHGMLADHLRRQTAILVNAEPAALITVDEAKPLARLLRAQVASLRHLVTVGDLTAMAGRYARPVVGADSIAFLQYTSGSTGNPKGVVLTHGNLLANIRADGQRIEVGPRDVFVSWLPLYHDMGLIGAWLGTMYHAVPLVVMSPLQFLTRPRRWLWAIHRYGGTLSAAPNFAYELCLKKIREHDLEGLDLSSWRVAFNGAEAVSAETVLGFIDRFRPYGFEPQAMYPVYGLAECTVGLAFPPLNRAPVIDRIKRTVFMRSGRAEPADSDDRNALRFVACGHALPSHEIRIVDENDREVAERQQGRLQFRGPSATRGYFRNPAATRTLFHGDWLDSGDLAYMVGGDVYLTGRIKDVIIRGGRNIYPEELEETLGSLAGVRDGRVVAFGSTDPASGTERLVVVSETRERDEPARERLRNEIVAVTTDLVQIPPDEVVLAPAGSILKTSSGKLRRADMRKLFEQGAIGKPRQAVRWQIVRMAFAGLGPELRRHGRSAADVAYAGYAWAAYAVLGIAAWALVMVLPKPAWRWRVTHLLARALALATATPLKISGTEHLPADAACILVANHASYLDAYVMAAVSPIPFSFVAKSELMAQPALRWFLQRMQTLFVERFDTQQAIVDAARIADAVGDGRAVLFFPEGTFGRSPGLLPFHLGAFAAAARTGIPVIPIVIRGTRSMLRSGSWFPRRGRISVTVGPPIEPRQTGEDGWSAALRLRAAARAYMLDHAAEPDLSGDRTGVS